MKLLEVRDERTMFILLCVDMNPDTQYQYCALRRYGYPCDVRPNIMITHLNGGKKANNDPYFWGDRTYATAHHYIIEHWNELVEGDVVDVSFILGETKEKKVAEVQV